MKPKTTLLALEKKFSSCSIPYAHLLQTQEWVDKREEIIDRDCGFCKKCERGESEGELDRGGYFGFARIQILAKNGFPSVEIEDLYISDKSYHLQVHHKFYVISKVPWDYADEALVTLCNHCHQEVHDTTMIPVFSHAGEALGYTSCHRCNSSGSFPEYSHVQNGICFHCNGARYEELSGR